MGARRKLTVNVGQRFGKYVVLSEVDSIRMPSGLKRMVECVCDCGNVRVVELSNLLAGNTRSCGCFKIAYHQQWGRARKRPGIETNLHQLYRTYQRKAAKRGLVWEIDKEYFLSVIMRTCHYCGLPPSNYFCLKYAKGPNKGQPRSGEGFHYSGIDRSDSLVGYTKNNCVPACWQCNLVKNNLTVAGFDAWVERIFEYRRMSSHTQLNTPKTVPASLGA